MTDVIDPVEALRKVRAALFTDRPDEIAPLNAQAVVCTLWANHLITLRDFLDAEITAAEAAGMVWVNEAEHEKRYDALMQIKQWCDAYPLDIFPEPDFKRAAAVLKEHGMTLDAISASNMRHALRGVAKIADAALTGPEQATRDGDAT